MKTNARQTAVWTIAFMCLVVCGCGSQAVVPSSYTTYTANDGGFSIDAPAEWQSELGGASGYSYAKFTSGSAEIMVDTNLTASLIGDISKIGSSPFAKDLDEDDPPPVAVAHHYEKAKFAEDNGVEEQPAVPITTGFGEGRKSEFTGTATFGGGIHGYRATALARERCIRIVCRCPEAEWQALQPAFDQVIASLGGGKR